MVVLCCGGREWDNFKAVERELALLPAGSVIVHGDCRGADKICGWVAKNKFPEGHFDVRPYPANWEKYGKKAGILRNQQMLDEEDIEYALAFHTDIDSSKGTKDMVKRLKLNSIPYDIIVS